MENVSWPLLSARWAKTEKKKEKKDADEEVGACSFLGMVSRLFEEGRRKKKNHNMYVSCFFLYSCESSIRGPCSPPRPLTRTSTTVS